MRSAYGILFSMSGVIKRPGGRKQAISTGFTIVETMIVLAITGVLFVSLATTISGKQNKTKFNQAINTLKTEIDQRIAESQSGYYPSNSDFNCESSPSGPVFSDDTLTEQGANDGCIFLGKLIKFNDQDVSYTVYTIAGNSNGQDYRDSRPQIVPNATEIVPLQHGVRVVWARAGGPETSAIAFTRSFKSIGDVSDFGSNQSDIRLIRLPLNMAVAGEVGAINGLLRNADIGEVQICIASGTTDQSGLMTIGGQTGSNTISLSIRGNQTCA